MSAARKMAALDRGWEVEWCSHIPRVKDDDGNDTEDSDLDNCTLHVRDFMTVEAARAYAKQIFPKDQFGSVRICRFEMLPYEPGSRGKYREYVGEVENYEGES